uniref:glycophorin-C isoform X2 n=1 Tax=Halichoerus grypus TaxID=9711 RepID=UPI0016591CDD|nr:glycophorin-C isoform X2 [Halichoerus grypus]
MPARAHGSQELGLSGGTSARAPRRRRVAPGAPKPGPALHPGAWRGRPATAAPRAARSLRLCAVAAEYLPQKLAPRLNWTLAHFSPRWGRTSPSLQA